jgi:hypothetical protein
MVRNVCNFLNLDLNYASIKMFKFCGAVYFYKQFRLSTVCAIFSDGFFKKPATRNRISTGGSLRKSPVEIYDL